MVAHSLAIKTVSRDHVRMSWLDYLVEIHQFFLLSRFQYLIPPLSLKLSLYKRDIWCMSLTNWVTPWDEGFLFHKMKIDTFQYALTLLWQWLLGPSYRIVSPLRQPWRTKLSPGLKMKHGQPCPNPNQIRYDVRHKALDGALPSLGPIGFFLSFQGCDPGNRPKLGLRSTHCV